MTVPIVDFASGEAVLDWIALTRALEAGHALPPAEREDIILRRGADTLLNRSAWIDGLGIAVKSATIFPGNRDLPTVNGGVSLFSDRDGTLEAVLDFRLVTKWKTAADSLLGAMRLARPDSRTILIVGSGAVARSLREAYGAAFPQAEFTVWNRSPSGAEALAAAHPGTRAVTDLPTAVAAADIVTCATLATEPILEGAWLSPGTHVDLIGSFRPDMREADDTAISRARIFADSRATACDTGELGLPIARGLLRAGDIVADFHDLARFARQDDDEITLFKNGGGAHLDLMTARHILDRWQAAQ